VGEHDELPASCAARMQQALPDAKLVVFRDCSHCPMYEDPAAYIGAVTRFLDKHRDGPRRGR
jgi:pimeloyl-ACP methyl ester carboxylesterase